MRKNLLLLLFILIIQTVSGQGIRGTIQNKQGEPLPFATIYIKEASTGTTSNLDGYFELPLPAGNYQIYFQYLGYQSVSRKVSVGNSFSSFKITMEVEVVKLQEVEVYGNEDPAYTIMRKAIAKSKYHTQQLDSFRAKVYIKGTGQLQNAPFFLRRRLKKEGVDPDRVFIAESVSEIYFERPDKLEEKVISIRSSGEDNNTNPNLYIMGSFYEPEIGGAISPLSPKAFAYYRFEYLGVFTERGYTVNKIRVIPRSRGENLFSGLLYIVDGYWSIFSLDLETLKFGLTFKISQIYNPIEDVAWLPVSHQFDVEGKILGFKFVYNYLASVSNYEIHINPDLINEFEVVDEKIEKELADSLDIKFPKNDVISSLENGEEITSKQLKKALKEYEKEELKERDSEDIASIRSFAIDSMAFKKDTSYWNKMRPIPLTQSEMNGYTITDSLAVIQREEERKDSLKHAGTKEFQITDLVFGKTYALNKTNKLRIHSVFENLNFNTVEGYNFDYKLQWVHKIDDDRSLRMGPVLHYAFSREKLSGYYFINYKSGESGKRTHLEMRGGRYVQQYSDPDLIHPFTNTIESLLLNRNLMKIYEKDFLSLNLRKSFSTKFRIHSQLEWSERRELFNTTSHLWINNENKSYTPNAPISIELEDTGFEEHRAAIFKASFFYSPWLKYRILNDHKIPIKDSSPEFQLHYRQGIEGFGINSAVNYAALEGGIKYIIKTGPRSNLRFDASYSKFVSTDSIVFMDYRHFGNRSLFLVEDPVKSFRLLDPYLLSTRDQHFSGHVNYQSGQFLLTQILLMRFSGIRENIYMNYLNTPAAGNYMELGYGIDYIFRIFRLELVTSFLDGEYQDFGVKIGVALGLEDVFN